MSFFSIEELCDTFIMEISIYQHQKKQFPFQRKINCLIKTRVEDMPIPLVSASSANTVLHTTSELTADRNDSNDILWFTRYDITCAAILTKSYLYLIFFSVVTGFTEYFHRFHEINKEILFNCQEVKIVSKNTNATWFIRRIYRYIKRLSRKIFISLNLISFVTMKIFYNSKFFDPEFSWLLTFFLLRFLN